MTAPQTLINDNIVIHKDQLHKILDIQEGEEKKPAYYIFDISQELLHQIDTLSLDKESPIVFTRSLNDLRETPLFMHGTSRHIGEFLWYDQYDLILKKYNNDTIADSTKQKSDLNIAKFQKIKFPLIYDELNTLVPHTLDELFQDERFSAYRDTIQPNDTLIVGMRQANQKYSFLYYETGKLVLATYASIWRGESTPRWLFRVDYKMEYKRSKKYKNAAMPYALHVTWNIFIHQGKVSLSTNSHGCNRLPGLYAEALYYLVTGPKIGMVNDAYTNKLDTKQRETYDSLKRRTPQVLIIE